MKQETFDALIGFTAGMAFGIAVATILYLAFPPPFAQAADSYTVYVTSYNPAVAQTDDTPCTGASGRDLCLAAKEGDHVIALSRDLLWFRGGPFRWHDKVKLTSDVPQCNGVFSVEDTLAARFRKRGDLFFLDRKDNTSCTATIEKVVY